MTDRDAAGGKTTGSETTGNDMSRSDMPGLVQENLIAYMRIFANLPGMHMRDHADSFWFVSNRAAPGNVVLRARWLEDGAEERIDQTFDAISRHADSVDWMVFPGDTPADLGARLTARGMPGGSGGNWLYAELDTLGSGPTAPDGFRVERVRDHQAMAAWVQISEAGFGAELGCFYDAYARHGYGPDAFSLHYTGFLGDTPVTSGTLLDAGGSASIYDVSTPPELRGQGFGAAITHSLMREVHRRGHPNTWIWSSDLGQGVYRRLGYRDVDFGLREYTWDRTTQGSGTSSTAT